MKAKRKYVSAHALRWRKAASQRRQMKGQVREAIRRMKSNSGIAEVLEALGYQVVNRSRLIHRRRRNPLFSRKAKRELTNAVVELAVTWAGGALLRRLGNPAAAEKFMREAMTRTHDRLDQRGLLTPLREAVKSAKETL